MIGNGLDKNVKKESDKLNKQRLSEVVPVAREVIKLVADSGLAIGDIHAHDNEKYNSIAKQIIEIMLNKNIKYVDRAFLFQLVLQPFDQIREIVTVSLERSFNRALDKSFGKEFGELRLSDVDLKIKGN